jgi:flagellar hook assembly protein FlgD
VRRPAAGILAASLLLATFAVPASTAAATAAEPKVVLVVGATGGTTATYKAWMNEVYAAASKYTDNVVKVYSPNATWAAISAAAQGANILVYMGHGNGFPSPYRTTPYAESQNGFGANATAGGGDSNTKYYGESYVARDIRLAPNAVVILSHLCYASGNSEPGKTAPTLSQARQRMDNYAAGFIAAGARAVIADGHMDPGWYIDQLFSTHNSLDQVFRGHPSAAGTVYPFDSSRSPGYGVLYDPDADSPPSGFYRSMVSIPGLRADDVTGAGAAPTDDSPVAFTVPGAAQVTADRAGLWKDAELTDDPDTGKPPVTLESGAKVRLLEEATTTAGDKVLHARTLGGTAEGWMRPADLAPRDSTAPKIGRFAITPKILSPIISGSRASVSAAATEVVTWKMTVTDKDDAVLATVTATGRDIVTSWDGRHDGEVSPDGTYGISLTASDGWGNQPDSKSGTARVDATPPELSSVRAAGSMPATFSPNGDANLDTIKVGYSLSETASVRMIVRDGAGIAVRDVTTTIAAGTGSVSWDGRNTAGKTVADGDYAVELTPTDVAGNRGAAASAPTRVYTALRAVPIATPVFMPSDGDAYAARITLPVAVVRAATIGWRVVNAAGETVRVLRDAQALAAGSYTSVWDGRNDAGAFVPRGVYRSVVTATNGTAATSVATTVTLDAFLVAASDSTPARGQSLTFTVTSAEPLRGAPSLRISEPGRKVRAVTMTKVKTGVYRVTVKLVGTRTGSLVLRVVGTDSAGRSNTTRVAYTLH